MLCESTPGCHTSGYAKTVPAVPSQALYLYECWFSHNCCLTGNKSLSVSLCCAAHLYQPPVLHLDKEHRGMFELHIHGTVPLLYSTCTSFSDRKLSGLLRSPTSVDLFPCVDLSGFEFHCIAFLHKNTHSLKCRAFETITK